MSTQRQSAAVETVISVPAFTVESYSEGLVSVNGRVVSGSDANALLDLLYALGVPVVSKAV